MRRFLAPVGAAVVLLVTAACAGENAGGPNVALPTGDATMLFQTQAAQVAKAWREAPNVDQWRTGFVPLEELTTLPRDARFTDETKQAFIAGWFRTQGRLSGAAGSGTVTFPDGQALKVPLVSAAKAYAALDQGDPPPCTGRPTKPPVEPEKSPATPQGADGSTGTTPPQVCTPLTVTAARLSSIPLQTSRGRATVPAYLFTVRGLPFEIARVAVDPSAIGAVPPVPTPSMLVPGGLKSAQGLTKVDGARLVFRLGLGACDVDEKPLFAEFDDAVVIGGVARTAGDVCTDQLLLKPVEVTLAKPLGDRVVLDAASAAPQQLVTVP